MTKQLRRPISARPRRCRRPQAATAADRSRRPCTKLSALLSSPCNLQLVLSGARDELKQLARARLEESGWTDEVRQLCRGALCGRGRLPALDPPIGANPSSHAAWPAVDTCNACESATCSS